MADETDDLLRRAMKSLDDSVPSGYFEGLPDQVLARLENSSMESTTTPTAPNVAASGTDPREPSAPIVGKPAVAPASGAVPQAQADDDSGLHDIRSLAQSQKARLSSRRSTASPVSTEDVLASSSAGLKAVALPEPAKMVSLPELAELPSKAEIRAKDREDRAARTEQAKADKAIAATLADQAARAEARQPVATASSMPMAARAPSSRGPIIAIAACVLATAAAGAVYLGTRSHSDASQTASNTTPVVASIERKPTVAPVATPPPAPPPEVVAAAPPAEPPPPPVETPAPPSAKHANTKATKAAPVVKINLESKASPPPVAPKDNTKKAAAGAGGAEPSFDDLLKEAGVDQGPKKAAKPKLDKKALSGEDFKTGMSAVAARAQGCYKGTQGTAQLKLTVAPSGQVAKATVVGLFAGKPEADCVLSAVKSASFPPWDGGPQSFGYSYLLAE